MVKQDEWVPWYRRKEYKGNLTEDEKRFLDSFRVDGKHPAARDENLPEEVRSYINELELAVYDGKQDAAASKAFFLTGIGSFIIFLSYQGIGKLDPPLGYFVGGALVVLAWINHSREWKRNADGVFMEQKGNAAPFSRTDEKLQEYWELEAIRRFRQRNDGGIEDGVD